MIVDTSALVAVVFQEAEHERILDRLGDPAATAGIGTPTMVELGIVLSARLDRDARPTVTGLIDHFELVPVPFSESHWSAAVDAFVRFGRGRHRAALNFGDCMAYAVASLADQPLLFAGDDFTHTDLVPA